MKYQYTDQAILTRPLRFHVPTIMLTFFIVEYSFHLVWGMSVFDLEEFWCLPFAECLVDCIMNGVGDSNWLLVTQSSLIGKKIKKTERIFCSL